MSWNDDSDDPWSEHAARGFTDAPAAVLPEPPTKRKPLTGASSPRYWEAVEQRQRRQKCRTATATMRAPSPVLRRKDLESAAAVEVRALVRRHGMAFVIGVCTKLMS